MRVDTGPTFHEIVMNDPLPKASVQQAVVDFLSDRDDATLYGAMAVNAYINERRMTEDVDIASTRAKELAEELRQYLNKRLRIAVRVRTVREGIGYRLYQLAKPKNRHLVDIRPVEKLPESQRIAGVLVVSPLEVTAGKVLSCVRRMGKPKSFTDRRDLAYLLLQFPQLKDPDGPVLARLVELGADEQVLSFWRQLAVEEVLPEDDADEFES